MRTFGLSMMVVFFALSLFGCGGDGNDNPPVTCTEAKSLCARLTVPQTFSGTPTNLMALFFTTPTPAGMPAAILAQVPTPDIGPQKPLDLKAENITAANGTYYFYVALYMPGGGTTSPVVGVDYAGRVTDPIQWDGSAVNLGEVPLALYQNP
ncbi:MAG: hypothetical protein GYA21_16360 [Myxococcales bacterium]|nr:hypothetical protein [Myxococcales bacterium]